jgi:SurA-like protein
MMKPSFSLFVIVLFSFMAVNSARAGDVIDRIVATVNGHPILQSDWEEATAYEAFIDGRPLDSLTPADHKATLDRLIDQELLREQVHPAASSTENGEEVDQRTQEIRKLYSGAETEEGWRSLLARHGLNERELERRVVQQLDLTRFVDARLRPAIQIDQQSIEIYYKETLVPQVRKTGTQPAPLAEVTPEIKEVLTQKKMNDLLTAWLQTLRAESQIRSAPTFPSSGGQIQ